MRTSALLRLREANNERSTVRKEKCPRKVRQDIQLNYPDSADIANWAVKAALHLQETATRTKVVVKRFIEQAV